MTDPRPILRRARIRLHCPERWTQGASARLDDGRHCHPEDPAATSHCVVGAIQHLTAPTGANSDMFYAATTHLQRTLARTISDPWLTIWNDDPRTTHQDILDALDDAIRTEPR